MTVSVPGNLLIAGEYLIVEEGGPGLALAVEPRASAKAYPASDWSVEAVMGPTATTWKPGNGELPLVQAVFETTETMLAGRGFHQVPQKIVLDTSGFFYADGRKAGYGSSAAAAVALSLLLCRTGGLDGEELQASALKAALAGHRLAQGGRGSGYDVYASFHGGTGLFTGGSQPIWKALGSYPLPHAALFPGHQPVSSKDAVTKFRAWKLDNPESSSALTQESRRAVQALASARNHDEFMASLKKAAECSTRMGDAIGVSAHIAAPRNLGVAAVKASGAGNELGMAFFSGDRAPDPGFLLEYGAIPLMPSGAPQWLL